MASFLGRSEKKLRRKCPSCSAFSTKTYDDIGFWQHCIVMSQKNTNPVIARSHSVLLNDSKGKLSSCTSIRQAPKNMSSQLQNNAIRMPMNLDLPDKKRKSLCDQGNGEAKTIWPWMGILMNINYEQVAKKYSNGKSVHNTPWNVYLKIYFSYLNPRGVQAFRTQGLAVLDFGHDLLGFFDAQDFEKGFAECGRGKVGFESRIKHQKEQAQTLFGWIADENDYNQTNPVGEYLRKRGTFRAKPCLREAWTEQHDILLQDVQSKLQEKNMKLMVLGTEVCTLRTSVYQKENQKYAAEAQFLLMENKQKQELDAISERMNQVTKSNADELMKEREKNNFLQAKLRKFQEKCQHLEENNTQDTSDETLIPKLINLVEEKEELQDTLEKLIYKERDINDKFQSAMEAAKEVLQENTRPIGIKKVGHVEEGPWKKAFAKKFKDPQGDWELSCTKMISQWNEVYLRDPFWCPYQVVQTDSGKFEEQIDTNDEKLAKLNEEFGVEVWKTVVDALNELREFNASGRYPISVPWNFDEGRAARLDEIIKYLASDSSKKRKSSLG